MGQTIEGESCEHLAARGAKVCSRCGASLRGAELRDARQRRALAEAAEAERARVALMATPEGREQARRTRVSARKLAMLMGLAAGLSSPIRR